MSLIEEPRSGPQDWLNCLQLKIYNANNELQNPLLSDIKEISYDRRAYESVDLRSYLGYTL